MKSNPKKYYLVITELLYRLRINAAMTQQQLAVKLKVPQSYISKIESGERRIDIIELRELCNALDSNIVEFTVTLEKELNETEP